MLAERAAGSTVVAILVTAILLLVGPAVFPSGAAGQRPAIDVPSSPMPQRVWFDADGELLPFNEGDDELLKELLRGAEVVDRENIPVGVTDPIRLTLKYNDTEFHGIFRFVDTVYDRVRMDDGRVRTNLKDSCHFEPAAYELARLLHIDSVPPAVNRRIGNDNGSLQIWVYGTIMEDERLEQEMRAPDRTAWTRQVNAMYLFDALIGNDDRTQQNILIDENWKIWLIDHTRAFYARAEAPFLSKVIYVEKNFWGALQALDKASLTQALDKYLTGSEIDRILERRERVVAHIQGLIDTRTEGAVIYEWGPQSASR